MNKLKKLNTILLITVTAVVFSQSVSANAENETPPPFAIISMPDTETPYVSIVSLAERFNMSVSYDPVKHSMTTTRGDNRVTVSNKSTTALFNDTSVNLMVPARMIQGAMFVPVKTYLPLFSDLLSGTLKWDERKKEIDISEVQFSLRSVSFENREGGSLIRIALAEPLEYSEVITENNWLRLRFSDATYDQEGIFQNPPMGLIRETRHFQHEGAALLSFKVSDEMGTYSIAYTTDPQELLISLRYKRTQGTALSDSDENVFTPMEPLGNKDLWTIDVVVIDPGHGGKDPGTVSPGGTKEKDINLAVAGELKKIIDTNDEIKAVMTRDKDVFVGLKERAEIANEENGKLFISIHANSNQNKRVSGMEIYFLSAAKTENAKRVAERENASIQFEENPENYLETAGIFKTILGDMASNVFLKESQNMCRLILESGISATKQNSGGVRQAGFYVMLGTQATMPSVLVELGYLSNANEEKMLKRVSYQKRVAEAIYAAIVEFKNMAERDLISRGD